MPAVAPEPTKAEEAAALTAGPAAPPDGGYGWVVVFAAWSVLFVWLGQVCECAPDEARCWLPLLLIVGSLQPAALLAPELLAADTR